MSWNCRCVSLVIPVTRFSSGLQNYTNTCCPQWGQNVPKKAASATKNCVGHVDMVNILWIKKNHLHFAMQMVKSVEVAGFEPAAFWSRSALKFRHLPFRRKSKISKHFSRLKAIAYNHLQAFATRFPPSARAFYQNFCTVSILFL